MKKTDSAMGFPLSLSYSFSPGEANCHVGKAQMAENRGKLQADSKQRTEVFSVKVHEDLQAARGMCKSLEVDSLLSWLLEGSLERP